MEPQQAHKLAKLAREGDYNARDKLISGSRPFIEKVAAQFCRRSLDWQNDDELSVALLAFNEAIDKFDPKMSTNFFSYARMVVHRRLVDHFRKEKRHRHLSLENSETTEAAAFDEAWEQYQKDIEVLERMEEIKLYARALQEFGFNLDELERSSPRHKDTREKLTKVARLLSSSPDLARELMDKGQLPLKELSRRSGISVKSIKKGRKYIIAIAILLIKEDFPYLRSYFNLTAAAKEGCR